jgi:hypothetical protein
MPWLHRSFWIGPALIAITLALLAAIVSYPRIWRIYRGALAGGQRERRFLAAVGFFVTAMVVRGITFAIHNHIGPFHDISMRGRHIHHLVWGILLLLIVGYTWLNGVGMDGWIGRLASLIFGVAAALTLDEFALWLNLSDVYWQREGRESYEALGLFGSILAVGVLGVPFFRGLGREIGKPRQRSSR